MPCAKLMFVAATSDDANMDVFVYAEDFLHAVRQWKVRYPAGEITWPEKVVVFTVPPARAGQGIVEWRSMHHIEINPRDVV